MYGIANEFQGLPAAFLGMGTKGVISSLWPVGDGPALLLMDRLMDSILVHRVSIPVALRDAQIWLRDAHGEQLAEVARRLLALAQSPD